MTREGESDHLVRLLRGFSRLYREPVINERANETVEGAKLRTGALIVDTFERLDGMLRAGEPLPEEWDGAMLHKRRYRPLVRDPLGFAYTFPPGAGERSMCSYHGRPCRWIDPAGVVTACLRCHTIRRQGVRLFAVETTESEPSAELDS